jgi:transposase-like protein
VDQNGNVLDILVQSRRNTKAAKRFFRKLLKGLQYVPRVILTDKLRSCGAAKREGVWDRVLETLRMQMRTKQGRDAQPSAAILDSQSIPHQRGSRS